MEREHNGRPKGNRHRRSSTETTGSTRPGTLILIGGREVKTGAALILRQVAERVRNGCLIVATLASSEAAEELWEDYQAVFRRLGVRHVAHLHIEHREQPVEQEHIALLSHASVVFFTGGDQLRIASKIEGTPMSDRLRTIYQNGGTIAGTSAGASVMGEAMLVSGPGTETYRIGGGVHIAPGLGLMPNVIIDQHFAERGRIGRLLGAVALNPRLLGVGIDENTAIVVEQGTTLRALGSGAVYLADGRSVTSTNISEEEPNRTISIFDMRLHVLSQADTYDLQRHRPACHPAKTVDLHR